MQRAIERVFCGQAIFRTRVCSELVYLYHFLIFVDSGEDSMGKVPILSRLEQRKI